LEERQKRQDYDVSITVLAYIWCYPSWDWLHLRVTSFD
jgi:hypothetical protein